MFDPDKDLFSNRPISMDRLLEIFRKGLKLFPQFKLQLIQGSPEEQLQARSMAQKIFDRIEEEIDQTCHTLGVSWHTMEPQILSFFDPREMALLQEMREFIRAHHQEIFAPVENRPSTRKPQAPRLRC
jgi:hypothetical protein